MSNQSTRPSKTKRCQVVGCNVDLKELKWPYNLKKRLCPKHMQAEAVLKEGSDTLWRFCQQCGKLESLQLFEGNKRSCMLGLQRRRDSHSSTAAEKQQRKQQQHQQQEQALHSQIFCQAGIHASGRTCQPGKSLSGVRHQALAGCQAGSHLSGPGFQATWNPSLAAAAAPVPAAPAVCYSSSRDCSSMLPVTTSLSSQSLAYISQATTTSSATEAAAAVVPAAGAAAVNAPAAATVHAPDPLPPSGSLQRNLSSADLAAAAAKCDIWNKAQMMIQPQAPVAWCTAAAVMPAAAVAAAVPAAPSMRQAAETDLVCLTSTAVLPGQGSTGFDCTDMAVLNEVEQQLVHAVNVMQAQAKAAAATTTAAAAAAAEVPQTKQLHGGLARAAIIARLQQLTQQFEILQQALQEDLPSEIPGLQHGQDVQQQQQLMHAGVTRCASVQSSAPSWQA